MPVNIVLDATMLDTFSLCEAKFDYRFNHRKVLPAKPKPLDSGGLLHIANETYYNDLKEGNIQFDERLDHSLEVMRHSWLEDSELSSKEYNELIIAVKESLILHRERDEHLEVLAVETPFAYVLHEDETIKITMIGKIDLLVNEEWPIGHTSYEKLPYDHKSYSRSYPARRLMNQFCNYAYATGSRYLVVNKIGMQTSLKPIEKHKRIILSYDDLILEQWKQNTISLAYKYLECHVSGEYPMNLTSCDKFNRECEYYPVCDSSGKEAKWYKLNTMYNTADVWDVSASLGKKE